MAWKNRWGQQFLFGSPYFEAQARVGKPNLHDCLCHQCEERQEEGKCILMLNPAGGDPSSIWVCEDCRPALDK